MLLQGNRMTHIKEDLLRHHWTPESLQMLNEERDRHQNLVHELEALDTPRPAENEVHDSPDRSVSLLCWEASCSACGSSKQECYLHGIRKERDTCIKTMQIV